MANRDNAKCLGVRLNAHFAFNVGITFINKTQKMKINKLTPSQ